MFNNHIFIIQNNVYNILFEWIYIQKNIDFIYSIKVVEKDPLINLTYIKIDLALGIQRQDDGGEYIYENESFFYYSIESIEQIEMIESEHI